MNTSVNSVNRPLAAKLATLKQSAQSRFERTSSSVGTVIDDIAQGFFDITHNGFALLGLGLVCAAVILAARPDLRDSGEGQLFSWLQERKAALEQVTETDTYVELDAIDRATAANPTDLPKPQAALAYWLSRKYGVAPEPLSVLVSHAFEIGQKAKLDPTLILAIMAIESGFNPFAQSHVGAQGLMQVMTKVHHDKYEDFGGKLAAFDPVTNLRVGVKVLQECIARAGSIEGGLKYYVGAANLEGDGGYASKVMAEHARLLAVIGGKSPAPAAQLTRAPQSSTPSALPVRLNPAEAAERVQEPAADKSPAKTLDAGDGKIASL